MKSKRMSLVSGFDVHMEGYNGGFKMEAKKVRKHWLTVFKRIEPNLNNSSIINDWLGLNLNEMNLKKIN